MVARRRTFAGDGLRPVRAGSRLAFLAGSCQVEPVLEQPPQQLPAPHVQLFLQLTVLQPRRLPDAIESSRS
jgi:hypothetical protein